MGPAAYIRAFLREAVANARAERWGTVVTALVVAASAATIHVVAVHAASTEAAVLAAIDAQGTRTVVVRATEPVLTAQFVDTLGAVTNVESVLGLGGARDATAAAVPGGPRIGVRTAYGRLGRLPVSISAIGADRVAWASPASTAVVGMPSGRGALRLLDGEEIAVTSILDVPDFLHELEPLTVLPLDGSGRFALDAVHILVRDAQDAEPVAGLVRGLLAGASPDAVSIQTSESLVQLRTQVGGTLATGGRATILLVVTGACLLAMLNVVGAVLVRRRDLGRRRALGATQLTIVLLIVAQTGLVALAASTAGTALAAVWTLAQGGPQVGLHNLVAAVLALSLGPAAAAALPAALAAGRDPLRELRVP